MKKIGIILAAAAMCLLPACDKDNGTNSGAEVGKWYAYNVAGNKSDVAFVLDMKADASADFIIPAWGVRMLGTYNYDGKTVTISVNKYMGRPNAVTLAEEGVDPCAPENLYKRWNDLPVGSEGYEQASSYTENGIMKVSFTFEGDKGIIEVFNKPCEAERQ